MSEHPGEQRDQSVQTVEAIAVDVGGIVEGDGSLVVQGLAGLKDARTGDLSFVGSAEFLRFANTTAASALLVGVDFEPSATDARALIRVSDPAGAMESLLPKFRRDERPPAGIEPLSAIADGVTLGENVVVGAGVSLGVGVTVGDDTVLHAGVRLDAGCTVGRGCVLHANVVVRACATLGDRVTLHAGTVVGSDGFGFRSSAAGHEKLEHIGTVVIEDDVEIGANCVIDRARFGRTRIGAGTKIDNLCQVAHNVQIGRGCLLAAQVGVSGSTVLGDGVVVGGQAGFSQNLDVGAGTMVSARAGVIKDHEPGSVLYGNPAGDRSTKKREVVALRRLPALISRVKKLEGEQGRGASESSETP